MNTKQMREHVRSAYGSFNWKLKVDRMPDNQVIAVYYSLLNRGAFNKKKTGKLGQRKQLTIFDYDERGQYVGNR